VRIAGLLVLMTGCFAKPGPPGGGASGAPVPRLLHTSNFWQSGHSPGTTYDAFTIDTTGVVDGDLLLFVASIDNGSSTTWPLLPGFTQVAQHGYGTDLQSNVIEAKIAAGEPSEYSGTYQNIVAGPSHASILALIAVSGVDAQMPIETSMVHIDSDYFDSARGTVSGLDTTQDDTTLIYVNSGDWLSMLRGDATFHEPPGFTKLVELGDHGDAKLESSTLMISYANQRDVGPVEPVSGSTTATNDLGTIMAEGYAALIAVQP
jgi:hypothetical protein